MTPSPNFDRLASAAAVSASLAASPAAVDQLKAEGVYSCKCFDADGNLKWEDTFENTVMTLGKNLLLDSAMAGSAYTAAFYMGLISSVSYTAIAAADTSASHAGWLEAGVTTNYPLFSQTARPTCVFSVAAAGVKALSASLTFNITGTGGTVQGAFLSTIAALGGTTGTLFSAGLFTGGAKVVAVGDTLNVSYSLSV